jgi:hypothetical protein
MSWNQFIGITALIYALTSPVGHFDFSGINPPGRERENPSRYHFWGSTWSVLPL